MKISIIKAKEAVGERYRLGVSLDWSQESILVRVCLIWWHVVIYRRRHLH